VVAFKNHQTHSESSRCDLGLPYLRFDPRHSWIDQKSNRRDSRNDLVQQFKALCDQFLYEEARSGEVAARTADARNEPKFDRVYTDLKYDWNRGGP